MDMFQVVKKLPKVELHCHLDGSVRPETILEIVLKEKLEVPTTEIEEFRKCLQITGECESLKEYLTKFPITISAMQKKENIYRITDELLEDLSKNNVKYVEVRCAPLYFTEGGLSFEEVVETILKAMAHGKEKYGITAKLIVACMRHLDPKITIDVVEKCKPFLGKGLVAIDLAGNEHDFPPELHKEAFDLAKKYGFHCTIHAGETGIARNIVTSIEELGAERVGHGVFAYMDEDVYDYVKKTQIPLEMCITSNVHTMAVKDYKSHPIKKYLDDGIKVTVNTDNMSVSNTNLNKEFVFLIKEQGFTIEDIKKVEMNSIDACFASEEEKEELRKKFNAEFTKK